MVAQFIQVGEALSEALPAHVRIACVHDEDSLTHAACMTRLLTKMGLQARAFDSLDLGLAYAKIGS